jgi:hypothetical protein
MNDGLAGLTGDHLPRHGDVLFCFSCGTFSVWHDRMVKPTPDEFQYIGGNPYLQAVQLTWMEQRGAG